MARFKRWMARGIAAAADHIELVVAGSILALLFVVIPLACVAGSRARASALEKLTGQEFTPWEAMSLQGVLIEVEPTQQGGPEDGDE